MRHAPRRLRRFAHKPITTVPLAPGTETDGWLRADEARYHGSRVRAVRRIATLVLLTLACMPIQSMMLALPGSGKVRFPQFYWSSFRRLLGMRLRVIGKPAVGDGPVIYVANHSSWVDVPVLGGLLPACFIAKGEVGRWPLVGSVARLGRTVFVTRQRGDTARERDAMRERLARGDSLILFPEGTTSDGSRVMAFRSAFFAVADDQAMPSVQPVSVAYDRLSNLPVLRATRPLFAWFGDMDIASHAWGLTRHKGLRVSVLLHPPLDPASFANRKELSAAVFRTIAEGAAELRQNWVAADR